LAANAGVTTLFYVVVPGYYSPSTPQGDPSVLNGFALQTILDSTNVHFIEQSLTGPGVHFNPQAQINVLNAVVTLTGTDAAAVLRADHQAPS
jgi:hypothetical protein